MSDLDYYSCGKVKAWLVDKEQKKLVDLTAMDNELKTAYSQMNLNIGVYEEFAHSDFQESLRRLKKADEVMKNIPGYSSVKFDILGQTAQMYVWSGDLTNAEQYLFKAEKLMNDYPKDDLDKGFYWFITAKFSLIKGKNSDALEAINQTLELYAYLGQDSAFIAPAYALKADVLNGLAKYGEAYGIIKKVFDQQIGDKTPDHELQARLLTTLAGVEANLGKFEDGLKHIEQACAVFQNGNTEINTDYAAALAVKGHVLAGKNEYKEALASYLEAEKVYKNRYRENFGTTQDIHDLLQQAEEVAGKAQDKENADRLQMLIKKYFKNTSPVTN
jgi:tetratricopeptide (TPR) repeat protein